MNFGRERESRDFVQNMSAGRRASSCGSEMSLVSSSSSDEIITERMVEDDEIENEMNERNKKRMKIRKERKSSCEEDAAARPVRPQG